MAILGSLKQVTNLKLFGRVGNRTLSSGFRKKIKFRFLRMQWA